MMYGIIVGVIVVLVIAIVLGRDALRKRRDRDRLSREVHDTRRGLTFLVNENLEVEDTNYFELNPDVEKKPPYLLGNVLHCQNGIDCGECGTGFACQTCPVRYVLKNALLQKRDFTAVDATMRLYDAVYKVQDVDVRLDGKLVTVNGEPRMLVKATFQEK